MDELPHDLCQLMQTSTVDNVQLTLAIGMLSHLRQSSGAEAAAHLERLAAEADVPVADLAAALIATAC